LSVEAIESLNFTTPTNRPLPNYAHILSSLVWEYFIPLHAGMEVGGTFISLQIDGILCQRQMPRNPLLLGAIRRGHLDFVNYLSRSATLVRERHAGSLELKSVRTLAVSDERIGASSSCNRIR